MIRDFDRLENGVRLAADVCIIGAGAAGITIAREFLDGPFKVLLLEGGGRVHEPESQALYDSDVVGLDHVGVHEGRARVLGGTTTWWAGQASPLGPIDFRRRE